MIILSQDRDATFTLSDKTIFNRVSTEDVYFNGTLMGINVIGKSLFSKTILGTFETSFEAEHTVEDIFRRVKAKQKYYKMPEPCMSDDELEVWL